MNWDDSSHISGLQALEPGVRVGGVELRDKIARDSFSSIWLTESLSGEPDSCIRIIPAGNLSIPDVNSEALRASLPELAMSSGSACSSGRPESSSVLRAMGISKQLAASSLRISLGRFTTADEVERAARRIADEAARLLQRRR